MVIFASHELAPCRARSRICAGSCPLGDNANFVGYNYEAAVSNLFAEKYCFSKPCFYCTSHSFAKNHSSLADKLIASFKLIYNKVCDIIFADDYY